MKKRIFSILLCLCIVMMQFPTAVLAAEGDPIVKVGGVTVDSIDWYATTDDNGVVTTTDAISANWNIHVEISGTTATMTLKDATIANPSGVCAIDTDGYDIDILLEGTENKIGTDTVYEAIYSSTASSVDITGEGDLAVKGSYGIRVNGNGNVNIDIEGSLSVESQWQMIQTGGDLTVEAESIDLNGYYIVCNDATLSATAGNVEVIGDGSNDGISASHNISVSAPQGEVSISGDYCGLRGQDGTVSVSAKDDVVLTGTVYGKTISITSEEGAIIIDGNEQRSIEGAQTSVDLWAPQGDITLITTNEYDNIISGDGYDLSITAAGTLDVEGANGILGYDEANIKAQTVNIAATDQGYGLMGGVLSITNPEGGNCSEVYIYGGGGGRDAIYASDLTIKADQVTIIADGSANLAINAGANASIGDGGMIVGNIYIDGTNSISENILMVDANYGDASAGLDLSSALPTISIYSKAGDGYVLYTPAEGETPATLVLHDAEIYTDSDSDFAVHLKEETVIKLEGTNYITNSNTTSGVGLFASYDGQECPVTIQGGNSDSLFISAWQCTRVGALTISGGRVDMNGSVHGMITKGDILIENGAQVSVTGGESGYALSAGDGMIVYDILTSPDLTEEERALELANSMRSLTLTGGSTLSVDGDADISGDLNVSDGSTLSLENRAYICGDFALGSGSTITTEVGSLFNVYFANSITNDGTIVNNGTFRLPYSYAVEQVEALNIPGEVELYDFVNDKSKVYVNGGFYVLGAILYYDDGLDLSMDTPTEPTYYKLDNNDEGYIIYTPASEDEDAVLILHNVNNAGDLEDGITLPNEAITLNLEEYNCFFEINASNNITISGDGLLNSVIINSNASAVLTVGSNATLNAEYREGVNKIIFYGTRGYDGDVAPANELELSRGAVLEIKYSNGLEFMEDTPLSNLIIGEGASIINNVYITLPMGITAEQIAALPLSGTGSVRVATVYDEDGRAINWNTYNNDGVAVKVIGDGETGLDLTDGDHSSSTIENNGYAWDSSTGTLTLGDNAYLDGSMTLPSDASVNISGNSIISGGISPSGTAACNLVFSGAGDLIIVGGISGSNNNGDILTIQGGAHVTAGNSIFLGASGGSDGTLNVTGEGTSLSVSSSYGYGVMCDMINLQNGASLTVNADLVGVQALSGGVNVTGGATLTTNCEYGVYITDGMLYVEPGSRLITNGSIAPFCVEDNSKTKTEIQAVSLPGIPAGTQITSVTGTDTDYSATYWSLVPTGGSLGVSNENRDTVTLSGAVQGIVTFQRISSPTPSGGGQTTSYTLTFDTKGGSEIIDLTKTSGTVIDLSAYKPIREGFDFEGWYSDEKLTEKLTEVKLTQNTIIYAKWTEKSAKANNPFTDVAEDSYYYDAVLWAVQEGVTSGTSATAFSPNMVCTRAQMVTFLWRTIGSPEPKSDVCRFNDVSKDTYYYKAVLWAEENGVTVGTSATAFSPEDKVTRGQAMSFLWRLAGRPASTSVNPFADVPKGIFYYDAILWAVEKGITYGTSQGSFSPDDSCLRAQIVTFLYRYMKD